jgi:hypothetical protein
MNSLKETAEEYRYLYRTGKCTREEAKENIQPYIDYINEQSKIIAKKYNQKPKFVNFTGYIR